MSRICIQRWPFESMPLEKHLKKREYFGQKMLIVSNLMIHFGENECTKHPPSFWECVKNWMFVPMCGKWYLRSCKSRRHTHHFLGHSTNGQIGSRLYVWSLVLIRFSTSLLLTICWCLPRMETKKWMLYNFVRRKTHWSNTWKATFGWPLPNFTNFPAWQPVLLGPA